MATDYYGLCEAALLTRLRQLTIFFPKDEFVTDDDAILNKGADFYIVVTPDIFIATRVDGHRNDYDWNTLMDVYTRFTTQREAKARLKDVRAAVLEHLHPACLNHINGVSRTIVSANGGIFQDAPDRPNFIWQTFIVTVTQRVTFTF